MLAFCRQGRRRAGGVGAHRCKLHGGAGGVDFVDRGDDRVVKLSGCLYIGDDEKGGADLALLAVGGVVPGDDLAVALPPGDKGGRAAAIQEQRRLAAPGLHHLGHLILGVTTGDRVPLAIAHHGDHCPIRFDADGGVGHVAPPFGDVDLPLLHQQGPAAHGIGQALCILAVGDNRLAFLSNAEIVAAIDRVIGVPVNNQGACWLPGGHIVVVRVQGRHNGGIGVLFRAGEIGLGVLTWSETVCIRQLMVWFSRMFSMPE